MVGESSVGGRGYAIEWSGGKVINLGSLPGSPNSFALSINDAGQVVGYSEFADGTVEATEWSGGTVIDLGPGEAASINDAGQVAGYSEVAPPVTVPESSTWAMMLLGFAGLTMASYRRTKSSRAALAR